MRPGKLIAILLAVQISQVATLPLCAATDSASRNAHRVGFDVTFHGDPAPSAVGGELALNLSSMLRLHAGAAGYNDWIYINGPKLIPNYVVRPLAYGISYALVWFFTWIGHGMFGTPIVHLAYDHFLPNWWPQNSAPRTIFSYGGGANLFVPGWSFSPTVGVGWAAYTSSNHPFGMKDSGSHIYYSGGFDWQSDGGFNVGLGYNYCRSLPAGACGVYLNTGAFF